MSLTQTNVPATISAIFFLRIYRMPIWLIYDIRILLQKRIDFIIMTSYCCELIYFSLVSCVGREGKCIWNWCYIKSSRLINNEPFNRRSIKINAKQIKIIMFERFENGRNRCIYSVFDILFECQKRSVNCQRWYVCNWFACRREVRKLRQKKEMNKRRERERDWDWDEIDGLGIRCYANVYAAVVVSLKLRVSLNLKKKSSTKWNKHTNRMVWE